MSTFKHVRKTISRWTPESLVRTYRWVRYPWIREAAARLERRQRAFAEWNRAAGSDEIVLRPGLAVAIGPESREPFEHFGYRSEDMVHEMDGFLEAAKTASWFLDVGALHGIFSLLFTKDRPEATALAIEPSPVALACLRHNIQANPGCRVEPVAVALSDSSRTIPMVAQWHHLVAAAEPTPPGVQTVEIVTQTGDMLCEERAFEPDLIKIDIEGHEIACLKGLRATIARCRPRIFLEVHPGLLREHGQSPGEIADFCQGVSYGLFDVDLRRLEWSALRELETIRRFVLQPDQSPT